MSIEPIRSRSKIEIYKLTLGIQYQQSNLFAAGIEEIQKSNDIQMIQLPHYLKFTILN